MKLVDRVLVHTNMKQRLLARDVHVARPMRRAILVVIDGWGLGPGDEGDAISRAKTPTMDALAKAYPFTRLEASAAAVGLPEGQMGNSEVGHLTIGAGRIVEQDIVRISRAVDEGRLLEAVPLRTALESLKARGGKLHILGLLGPGGVHSHRDHLYGLLRAASSLDIDDILVHHVLDGRDTPPKSAQGFLEHAQPRIAAAGARVATVIGRYWAMDRDTRWDRTQRAYDAYAHGAGHQARDATQAVGASYERGQTDEFVEPTVLPDHVPMTSNDLVVVYNFRPDRVRQIVRAFCDPSLRDLRRGQAFPRMVTLTEYDADFNDLGVGVAFEPVQPRMTLGEHASQLGLRQLRIAETEKYAHVTYFLNGGRETPFVGEHRILVPSPKVATYDQQPEMSAPQVTERLAQALATVEYDLVVLNFANPDMVGHTGQLDATIRACEVVDDCLGSIQTLAEEGDYVFAVTADHGNAETMREPDGSPRTAHTTAQVPFILAHRDLKGHVFEPAGSSMPGLSCVAPTLLALMGRQVPPEMTTPPLGLVKRALK